MLTCRWYTKSFANPCESCEVFLSNFIVFCLPKSQWIKRYKQSNHTYQDFPKRFCDPRKIRPSISWLNYTSLQSTMHCHGLYILQFEVEKKDTHNYPTCHVSRHHLLADSFPQASGHSRTSIPPFKAASTGPPKAFPVNVRARIAKITTVLGWTCWAPKKCERNLRDFTVDKELDTENYGLEQVLPDGKLRCPCPISGQYPGRLGRSQDNLRSLVASVASHRIPAELRLISVQYEMKKWSTALWNWTWKKWPLASMNQSRLNAGLD